MNGATGFTDSLPPDFFRKEPTFGERPKELVTPFGFAQYRDSLLAIFEFDKDHVRRIEPFVFEADAYNVSPPEGLIPFRIKALNHSHSDLHVVKLNGEQLVV